MFSSLITKMKCQKLFNPQGECKPTRKPRSRGWRNYRETLIKRLAYQALINSTVKIETISAKEKLLTPLYPNQRPVIPVLTNDKEFRKFFQAALNRAEAFVQVGKITIKSQQFYREKPNRGKNATRAHNGSTHHKFIFNQISRSIYIKI